MMLGLNEAGEPVFSSPAAEQAYFLAVMHGGGPPVDAARAAARLGQLYQDVRAPAPSPRLPRSQVFCLALKPLKPLRRSSAEAAEGLQ